MLKLNIEVKSDNPNSNEYKASQELKTLFLNSLLDTSALGRILIVPNATFYGSSTKDVDILVVGELTNCTQHILIPDLEHIGKNKPIKVEVKSFICVIELKTHTHHGVWREGTNIYVSYNGHRHNVTNQSEGQKNAILNFFKSLGKNVPYISNLVWFRALTPKEVDSLLIENGSRINSNLLPSEYTFTDFIREVYINGNNKNDIISAFRSDGSPIEYTQEILNFFTKAKTAEGELTRRKIEQLTNDLLSKNWRNVEYGSSIMVFNGRAGTGKTNSLLKAAYHLAINENKRVLILTYNKALASDIRRINTLAGIPDDFDGRSVRIKTIHSFFYHFLRAVGIYDTNDNEFLCKYDELLHELYDFLDKGLINTDDKAKAIELNVEELSWDYIFVDEAQDFLEIEKDVLFKLFGTDNFTIANGIDQRIRGHYYCNWTFNIKNRQIKKLTTCLRQKENLVNFVNSFAYRRGMSQFVLVPEKKMVGGRVIITTLDYISADIHKREVENAKNDGNECYDYLFLVHPGLVVKENGKHSFCQTKEYEDKGIYIWDGTQAELRTEFPVYADQHRLLQYDSCRGLEGWTVVCLEFDKFLDYKESIFKPMEYFDDISLASPEEQKRMFVNEWGLIPLTRAIDTLIITINNKDHWVAKVLRDISKNVDYIQWIE